MAAVPVSRPSTIAQEASHRVCRSAIPVATAVLAVSIEGKSPTGREFASLLVLTAGVMISVAEGLHGSVFGITFACSSTRLGCCLHVSTLPVCTAHTVQASQSDPDSGQPVADAAAGNSAPTTM